MATLDECQQALQVLADRLASSDSSHGAAGFDRTLTCALRDLQVIFGGRLKNGQLIDIAQATSRDAQVRLTMTSDDLIALVDGRLRMATAWTTGRVRIEAGVRDLVKLRSIF